MTLTLELPPDLERFLEAEALRAGVPAPQFAQRMLAEALSEQQQDLEDAEEARRILAETKPEDYVSWEQVKAELASQQESAPVVEMQR